MQVRAFVRYIIVSKIYSKKVIGFVWRYILWSAKTIGPHKIYLHTNPITFKYWFISDMSTSVDVVMLIWR